MHVDAEPLQGNLFGDFTEASKESISTKKIVDASKTHLSDLQLAEDAKKRPRRRLKPNPSHKNETASLEKNINTSNDEEPAWANHSMVDPNQLTPVLRHYVELKAANPSKVLLYRLGDFYECFFEDAIRLSRILELTLTGKDAGKTIGRVPMAGVPHHAAERYCAELIRRGISVALCDQLESKPSKGSLLKREITRILTPGTVIEEGMLSARKNNWLGAVFIEEPNQQTQIAWGLASADVSTGEFILREGIGLSNLKQEISQINASEIVWGGGQNAAYPKTGVLKHLN